MKANGKGLGFYCIYSKRFLYRKQTVNTALFIKVSLFSGQGYLVSYLESMVRTLVPTLLVSPNSFN